MAGGRTIKLTATGDIDTSGGQLQLLDGNDAVLQSVRTRLQFFRGEWFLDLTAGLPWFQDVLVKNPDPNQIHSLIKNEILNTPGITELISLNLVFDRTARTLRVTFQAMADSQKIGATLSV